MRIFSITAWKPYKEKEFFKFFMDKFDKQSKSDLDEILRLNDFNYTGIWGADGIKTYSIMSHLLEGNKGFSTGTSSRNAIEQFLLGNGNVKVEIGYVEELFLHHGQEKGMARIRTYNPDIDWFLIKLENEMADNRFYEDYEKGILRKGPLVSVFIDNWNLGEKVMFDVLERYPVELNSNNFSIAIKSDNHEFAQKLLSKAEKLYKGLILSHS